MKLSDFKLTMSSIFKNLKSDKETFDLIVAFVRDDD
jgi:hypothetical protein